MTDELNTISDPNKYEERFLGVFINVDKSRLPEWCKQMNGMTAYFETYNTKHSTGTARNSYHLPSCEYNDRIIQLTAFSPYNGNAMCFPKQFVARVEEGNRGLANKVLKKEWDDEN